MPASLLYLDPTAAGLGLQMVLAGLVGGLVAVRMFWGRVFSLFHRTKQDITEETSATEEVREAVEEEG
jgi:hypothetical protein